jgi:hypothetical protein
MVVRYGKLPMLIPLQYGSLAATQQFTFHTSIMRIYYSHNFQLLELRFRAYAMCTPTSTPSVEEKTPESLAEMVTLRSLPHSQRQRFGLSHNCRHELDLLEVKNPLTPSKLGFSVVDEDGEIGLDVSGNTRWNKRGTGSKYNSGSGCYLITGNKTKRVLAACPMSRRCGKCELKKDHPKELCPKNYNGSSKGMEAHGLSINVNWIYNTKKKNAMLESLSAMTTSQPNPFCGGHIDKRWRSTKCHGQGLPPTTRRRTMVC